MAAFDPLLDLGTAVEAQRPWRRVLVGATIWDGLVEGLVDGLWTLAGLWGEPGAVHMALIDEAAGTLAVASFACPDGRFPSVGAAHPPAVRLERALRDLYGLEPVGAADTRPWLQNIYAGMPIR